MGLVPDRATFFGLMRDVRAEIQNLQASLGDVKQKFDLTDPKLRAVELAAALREAIGRFARNKDEIGETLRAARALMRRNSALYDSCGDEVTHIENAWERIADAWPQPSAAAEEILTQSARIEARLNEIVVRAGRITIPSRANQHLEQLRVGQALDFHDVFADELPSAEDRSALLRYLAAHPGAVDGVVDVDLGVVYRADRRTSRRLLSCAIFAAALLGGVGVVAGLSWVSTWPDRPLGAELRFAHCLQGYLAVFVGALVHLLIDALKQARSQNVTAFRAVDDWLLWLHVKEMPILWGILSLWIGIVGLAFMQSDFTLTTAFFVGYSIDSFVDLFLQRFGKSVSSRTESVTRSLERAARPAPAGAPAS
jgi:hypothetical protein